MTVEQTFCESAPKPNSWVANAMPDNAEAGGGLFVAATQIAITLGATVGGIVFDFTGFEVTFIMSAVFFFLSSLVAIMAKRISFCNKPLNYHVQQLMNPGFRVSSDLLP